MANRVLVAATWMEDRGQEALGFLKRKNGSEAVVRGMLQAVKPRERAYWRKRNFYDGNGHN